MTKGIIDIDEYIDKTIKVKFKGKTIDVKEPSARLTKQLIALEASITEENALDIHEETVMMILNNNKNDVEFTKEDIEDMPFKVQKIILRKIKTMRERIDTDPN